ncbi:hypothetical protein ACT7C1_31955 [Bacillus paranthracis]
MALDLLKQSGAKPLFISVPVKRSLVRLRWLPERTPRIVL